MNSSWNESWSEGRIAIRLGRTSWLAAHSIVPRPGSGLGASNVGRLLILAIILFSIGCGDSGSGSGVLDDSLDGNWTVTTTAGDTVQFQFSGLPGTYNRATLRESQGMTEGQFEAGNYTDSSTAITFMPTTSTCPGPHPNYTDGYRLFGSTLVLMNVAGTISLTREATYFYDPVHTNYCSDSSVPGQP
jgi:hypothetical protein